MDPLTDNDAETEEPIAAWEALLLPEWRWEAFQKGDDDRYYGRVRSPMTYGHWEWGYFSQRQLKTAKAYRVDTTLDDDAELFPDGGRRCMDPIAELSVYETELQGLYEPDKGDT